MKKVLSDKRGMVLLLVLSVMALFTIVAVEFSADQGLDIELAYNFRDSVQSQYIARSGIEAVSTLLAEDDKEYDSEDEAWGEFPEYSLAASAYLDGPAFTGSIADECGKFDLNSLAATDEKDRGFAIEQFKRLFDLLEIDIATDELEDLAEAVRDWQDPEDDEGISGAEDAYYKSLDVPYVCKDMPMDSPEEILLVKGMKPEYYYGAEGREGIRNYVTVGTGGKINLNTASDVVLKSLRESVSDDVVEAIKGIRPIKSGNSDWAEELGIGGSGDETQWINKTLTVKSSRFSADVKGTMPSGSQINIKSVFQRNEDKVRVVYYKIY